MKFNVLRSVAASLSLGVCTIASAQYGPTPAGPYGQAGYGYGAPQSYHSQAPSQAQAGVPRTQAFQSYGSNVYQQPAYQPPSYQSPSKWSNFGIGNNSGPALFQPASTGQAEMLPAPEPIPTPTPNYGGPSYSNAPSQDSYQHAPQAQYSAPAPMQYSAPVQHSAPVQYSTMEQHGAPVHIGAPVNDAYCESCNQAPVQSQFVQAASQPWEGVSYAAQSCGMPVAAPVRAPLFPWFGSFDLLFFDLETNGKDRTVAAAYSAVDPTRPYLPAMGSSSIDPDNALGYNLTFGRYLGCGQYGLGVSYFNFDPSQESVSLFSAGPIDAANGEGGLRAGMPQYNGATMAYLYDNGGGVYNPVTGAGSPYTVYDIIDGNAGQTALDGGDTDAAPGGAGVTSNAEAVRIRAQRDVDIQGIEFNLFSFGLMGAQRASALSCGGGGCGTGIGSFLGLGGYRGIGGYGGGACGDSCQPCGDPCAQSCGPRFGFGGAAGPLVRPCNGKVQVVTSHGFRWFQFEETTDFAYDVDGRVGYTDNDIYDFTRVENNLFGYQFGSRLIYCLHNRVNFNVAGKFGIYGNNVEQRHTLGSLNDFAELAAMPGLDINYESEDTVLSTLGELDLGLGIRVSNAWTVRGGYRIMGVTGIATASDYARDYTSSTAAAAIHADKSLILHGAYVGADFNF
ncbi:hypothetical protein Pla100_55430 [Neorhodopirellula pilleata]|uniref:Uncharacterized protein n=2 Tax=Neorhodopirellula pilleata TaxID=2714738 RepID=A0A5C5ZQ63_9BACT|nr:hypothetical protein Pla100_55430 [Neorhodopirellula pilleata]